MEVVLRHGLGGVGVFAVCETRQWIVLCESANHLEVKRLPSLRLFGAGHFKRLQHVKTIRTKNFFAGNVCHFCFTDDASITPGLLLVATTGGVYVLDLQKNKLVGKVVEHDAAHHALVHDFLHYGIASHGHWACVSFKLSLCVYQGSGAEWLPKHVIHLEATSPYFRPVSPRSVWAPFPSPNFIFGDHVERVSFVAGAREIVVRSNYGHHCLFRLDTGDFVDDVHFHPVSWIGGSVYFGQYRTVGRLFYKATSLYMKPGWYLVDGTCVTEQFLDGDVTSEQIKHAVMVPGLGILASKIVSCPFSSCRPSRKLVLLISKRDKGSCVFVFSPARFAWISAVIRTAVFSA